LAVCIHGILLYDYYRMWNMGLGNARRSFTQDLLWTAITIAAVVVGLFGYMGPTAIFAAWAISCAIIGYVNAWRLCSTLRPRWAADRPETTLAIKYGLDYMAGSGAAQLPTYFIAGFAGVALVGALRGGGTLYGPFQLVITTGYALAIPYLARLRLRTP